MAGHFKGNYYWRDPFLTPMIMGGSVPRLQICAPMHFRKHVAADGTKPDLNFGFQGLAACFRAESTTLDAIELVLNTALIYIELSSGHLVYV